MPIQQILFRPKRGWVDFDRGIGGVPFNADPGSDFNTFYELDGVVNEMHNNEVMLTKNPVEFGADISNHAIKKPFVVVIKGVITNSPFVKQLGNKIPGASEYAPANIGQNISGTFTGKRIRDAYAGLVAMQNRRQPFTLYTGLLQYDNMVLTRMNTPNDITNKLDLTMTFEEVILPNLTDTTKVGYKPTTVTTEVDILAAAVAVATIGLAVTSLANVDLVAILGGS